MSPFRRILAARGVRHPAAYSMVIVIAGLLVTMVTSVTISTQASNRAIRKVQQAEEARRAEEARQREESRKASCQFILTINNAYQEDPPADPTPTAKNVIQAWADLAALCK